MPAKFTLLVPVLNSRSNLLLVVGFPLPRNLAGLDLQLPSVQTANDRRIGICKLPFGCGSSEKPHSPPHSANLGKFRITVETHLKRTKLKQLPDSYE